MGTIVKEETNVRIFEAKLHESKREIRREEMSKFVGRIVKMILLVLFLSVLALVIILFLTKSSSVVQVLLVTGGISFFVALSFMILKFTGVYTVLRISNPSNIQATDIAATLTLIGIFCFMAPILSGASYIPNLIESLENFMSTQKEQTEKVIEVTGESLKILKSLAIRNSPLPP